MNEARPGLYPGLLLVLLGWFGATSAGASNGMNMIGYGAVSISMGGADLAITDSAAAMNINPAGIGWCTEPHLELGVGMMEPSLTHSDRLGNKRNDSLDRYPIPFVGYVHSAGELTAGIGLFVQGGLGVEYRGLVSPFAARANPGLFPPGFLGASVIPPTDDVKTKLSHAKLTPTVAWRLSQTVTLGATLNVSYAEAEMEFLPQTSVMADFDRSGVPGDQPGESFSGLRIDGVSALAYGLRLGAQYVRDPLSLGFSYSTESDLDFDGGAAILNLTALGLGEVTYQARMRNFAWPQQVGAGLGYRLNRKLLVAVDVEWIDWSGAIDTVTISATAPNHPSAPPSREIQMPLRWRDQWVYAVGLEIRPDSEWTLRFGYNHGDTPVRKTLARPQFPAIAEDHFTAGFGYSKGPWSVDLALEFVPETEMINDNPDASLNPFRPGSTETLSQLAGYLTVRRVL